MSVLSRAHFHNEQAAFAYLESAIWPEGPVCTHCGCSGRITKVKANAAKRIRVGLYRCGDCKGQFRVTVGTVFEHMRLPLHKCLQAVHLMCSSKKGVSAHQVHRTLEITYKAAWFLCHRIREAMRTGDLAPMGSGGTDVQVDETFIWSDKDAPPVKGQKGTFYPAKINVLSLVDRATGRAQSFVVDTLQSKDIAPILAANISKEARLVTDEARRYVGHAKMFSGHVSVNHSKDEYVNRDDPTITTNHVEGYFSVFKRGMKGVYQHASKEHLHRYLAEFDFRYSNRSALGCEDAECAERSLKGIVGKRLTYRSANVQETLSF